MFMKYALKSSIGYRLASSANVINQQLTQLLKPYGIAIEQRATLEIIKFEPQANQNSIAQILGKDKTTVSRTLKALETKGFIVKTSLKNDKRNKSMSLTSQGEMILEQTEDILNQFRQSMNDKLTASEKETLFNLLHKLS